MINRTIIATFIRMSGLLCELVLAKSLQMNANTASESLLIIYPRTLSHLI